MVVPVVEFLGVVIGEANGVSTFSSKGIFNGDCALKCFMYCLGDLGESGVDGVVKVGVGGMVNSGGSLLDKMWYAAEGGCAMVLGTSLMFNLSFGLLRLILFFANFLLLYHTAAARTKVRSKIIANSADVIPMYKFVDSSSIIPAREIDYIRIVERKKAVRVEARVHTSSTL